jgi:hypothetical protein
MSVATLDSSGPGVLQDLVQPLDLPAALLDLGLAVAGRARATPGLGGAARSWDGPARARPAGQSMPRRPHRSCGRARCAGAPRSAASLHLALEQLPDRLPVAPGRLHPHPGHPEAGQPLGQQPQPGGRRSEPAALGVAPRRGCQAPAHTRSPSPCARLDPRSVRPRSPPARLLHLGNRIAAIRRSLYRRNLRLVLVATVRGARGSHVRLISGLAAPRERRRRPDDRHIFIRRGWPATAMRGLSEIDG